MIDLTLKVSCVVVLALLVSALARRHSAALRHWILTTAIVCAALGLAVSGEARTPAAALNA